MRQPETDTASECTADADSISENNEKISILSKLSVELSEIQEIHLIGADCNQGIIHIDWGNGKEEDIELTDEAMSQFRGVGSCTARSIGRCVMGVKRRCTDLEEENNDLRGVVASLLPKKFNEGNAIRNAGILDIKNIVAKARQERLLQKITLAKREELNPLPINVLVCEREVGRPSSAPPGKITKLDMSTQQACVLRLHDSDCENRRVKSSKCREKLASSFTSPLALTRRGQQQLGKRLCTEQLEKSKVVNTKLHEKYAPLGTASRVLTPDEISVCNDRLYYEWGKRAAQNRQKLFVRYIEDRLPQSKTLSTLQQQQMAERLTKAPIHTIAR